MTEEETITAQKICASCPVVGACLEYALGQGFSNQYGVYGGCSERQRRRMLKEREQGLIQMPQRDMSAVIGVSAAISDAELAEIGVGSNDREFADQMIG